MFNETERMLEVIERMFDREHTSPKEIMQHLFLRKGYQEGEASAAVARHSDPVIFLLQW